MSWESEKYDFMKEGDEILLHPVDGVPLPVWKEDVESFLQDGWKRRPNPNEITEFECGAEDRAESDEFVAFTFPKGKARVDDGYVKTRNLDLAHRSFPLKSLAACYIEGGQVTVLVSRFDLEDKGPFEESL